MCGPKDNAIIVKAKEPYLAAKEEETDNPLILMGESAIISNHVHFLSDKSAICEVFEDKVEVDTDFRKTNEKLIDCVWREESGRGVNMFGDRDLNGVPHAFGHFQIWIEKHPVSYDCAMDYSCSSGYFIDQVKAGNGWLWTTYERCKQQL